MAAGGDPRRAHRPVEALAGGHPLPRSGGDYLLAQVDGSADPMQVPRKLRTAQPERGITEGLAPHVHDVWQPATKKADTAPPKEPEKRTVHPATGPVTAKRARSIETKRSNPPGT